ncbi:hypothetical protein N7520_010394 [Penicillium odoratum]|uniref:uncharacterized protein n=1 Tax=Penicillium odoratum TaxID=1167516 RepID=UPI0025478C5F|nr:uncharacterized protein N7520_010394 [Penicillium odoratum]KAJ5745212.1 hypothetical protein N7520_010394 [Penicillium odoratum]
MHFNIILLASNLALWSSLVVASLGDLRSPGPVTGSSLLGKRLEKLARRAHAVTERAITEKTDDIAKRGGLGGLDLGDMMDELLGKSSSSSAVPTPMRTPTPMSTPVSIPTPTLTPFYTPISMPTPTPTPSSSSSPLKAVENLLRARQGAPRR